MMGKRFDLTGSVALVAVGVHYRKHQIAEQLVDFQDQEAKLQGPKFGLR